MRRSDARPYPEFEDNRILEEEDAMAREAGEINEGDPVKNRDVDDKIVGDNYAFLVLLNMRATAKHD